jgi:hypothetical protein
MAWLSQPGLMWESATKDAAKKGFQTKNEDYIQVVFEGLKKGRTNYGIRQELFMYNPPNTNISW